MIVFDDVSVAVPGSDPGRSSEDSTSSFILQGLNLSLSESSIALIGANGSGKSTIARLINGLILPASGTVHIESAGERFDTRKFGKQVRERVGFVFTDPVSGLVMPTVIEDVALSLRRKIKNSSERNSAALKILDEYGLSGREHQSVHSLSGGQSQLLAIATILALEPEILVADEPTTLLDLRNSRMVAELLLGLPQQLIVATHDLDFARRCERVLWVEDGRVRLDGDPAEVVTKYQESV